MFNSEVDKICIGQTKRAINERYKVHLDRENTEKSAAIAAHSIDTSHVFNKTNINFMK